MKTFISFFSGLYLLLLALPLMGAEDQKADWFKTYGGNDVAVKYSRMAGRKIALTNVVNEEISFKDGEASGAVPLNEVLTNRDVYFVIDYPPAWNGFLSLVKEGKLEDAIATLRPVVYPLVKFASLPNAKLNSHEILLNYAKSLVDAGYSVEAGKLFSRLPLNSLPPAFTGLAIRACEQLTNLQMPKDALATLAGFNYVEENAAFFPKVMEFAKTLRQSDYFEECQYVYQKVSQVKSSSESLRATLWSIYCDIRLGRVETARIAYNKLDKNKIGASTDYYPLSLLVQARILISENKYKEALEFVAQSVNRCELRDEWTPEIFYAAGECYESINKLGVARAIYSQTHIFYPRHPYGLKAKVKLDNLPVVDNKIKESVVEEGGVKPTDPKKGDSHDDKL